ncbi:uncharacterized protein DUF4249 [Chitinophaga skermanii]|uniref:Uncharacterized protein DUF4249 n=1 Tax=Chitinophaga skermanii TaxID=331697 RepID=A0A327QRP2_9BACT|nr:DUF4249 domain-containing protein [Chitinophaga skermanii]RAJ07020.1 uncharacterized protein DUF4249 [Chitinophaga skermanii]
MRRTRRYIVYVILALGCILYGACKDPYTPDLQGKNINYLVVDGMIVVGPSTTTRIMLSRASALKDTAKMIYETKAKVTVEVEGGGSYDLVESPIGTYTASDLNIAVDKKVRLKIATQKNDQYISSFVPVRNVPPIDTIASYRKNDVFTVYVNTHDPSNSTKYYRWTYEGTYEYNSQWYSRQVFNNNDSTLRSRPYSEQVKLFRCWKNLVTNSILVASSERSSVDQIVQEPLQSFNRDQIEISVGYRILVRQYALTSEAYDYLNNVRKYTEQLGGIFDPLPTELRGNIVNVQNPAEPVVGYISASMETTKARYFSRPSYSTFENKCGFATEVLDQSKAGLALYFGYDRGYPVFLDPEEKKLGVTGSFRCLDCLQLQTGGYNVRPDFWPF